MRFKAYSVYLLFKFCFSLMFSMATVLSLVYHLEVVNLNAFELILVGTVLETSCFLLEIPTGVVADLYSRRRSVLIGVFLYGGGFVLEGALPWFATVLIAQVVWGCGDTFTSGALEAWIASEERNRSMDKVFLRGSQIAQVGSVLGVVLGTLLGNLDLRLPIVTAGLLCLLLGLVLLRIMPETNFSPVREEKNSLLADMLGLFKVNLNFIKGVPILLALLAITFCGGLASEGFDRLSTAHFLEDTIMPSFGPLNSVTWFGVMSLLGSGLGIFVSQVLIVYLEKRGTAGRTGVVFFTSTGYILGLILFAFGKSFWVMLAVFLAGSIFNYRSYAQPEGAGSGSMDERARGRKNASYRLFNERTDGLFRSNHRWSSRENCGTAAFCLVGADLYCSVSDSCPVSDSCSRKGREKEILYIKLLFESRRNQHTLRKCGGFFLS